eukprot:10927503-Karenia_brevis.AAC.2
MEALESMFDMPGWQVSLADAKRLNFSKVFVSLGAKLDYAEVKSGTIVVQNKPRRAEAIVSQIIQAFATGLRTPALMSIRGK